MFIDPYTRLPDSKNFSLIKDKNISGFQSVAKGHSSIVFSKSVWPIGGLARRENGWNLWNGVLGVGWTSTPKTAFIIT